MKRNKAVCILLSALILSGICVGCGSTSALEPSGDGCGSSDPDKSELVYQAFCYPLTQNGDRDIQVSDFCISDSVFYFFGSYVDRKTVLTDPITGEPAVDSAAGIPVETENYVTGLFAADIQTGAVRQIDDYVPSSPPDGMLGDSYLAGICAGTDGSFWTLEEIYTYSFDYPEGTDPAAIADPYQYYTAGETSRVFTNYSSSGEKLRRTVLQLPENAYADTVLVMEDSTIIAYDHNAIYVLDETGALTQTVPAENVNGSIYCMDDEIHCLCFDASSGAMAINRLDIQQGAFEKVSDGPTGAYNLAPGFGPYDYLFPMGDSVYGRRAETDTLEKLFSWMACDVDYGTIDRFQVLPDGTIAALESVYTQQDSASSMIIMRPVDHAQLPQKQELTLGCIQLNDAVRRAVVKFNRSSSDTRITVRDYSDLVFAGEYTESTWGTAVQKLNTEIMSGQMPDLLCTDSLPVHQYAADGLLTDLWPWIDGDPQLFRDDLMSHFLDAVETDGKLFEAPISFQLRTLLTSEKIADGRDRWTVRELLDTFASMEQAESVLGPYMTAPILLQLLLSFDLDTYIQWEENTCDFRTTQFMELLGMIRETTVSAASDNWSTLPEEEDQFTKVLTGKQAAVQSELYGFEEILMNSALFEGKPCYIGFPTEDLCGSAFVCGPSVAISASCRDAALGWRFVRTLLLEETQSEIYHGFPVNRHAFEAMKQEVMTPVYSTDPETGEQVEYSRGGIGFAGGRSVELYAMRQEEFDVFWKLYESCTKRVSGDYVIGELVAAECAPYFAGTKTAEETADLVQAAVSLYLMEQA